MSNIIIECAQGSDAWLQARAGVITASRFRDARSRVGGLTEQQAAYVAALRSGMGEREAIKAAGYQKAPTARAVERSLAGERVDKPSEVALRYAQLLAIERIAGEPLDDTFQTWAMKRGQDLEPVARELYEDRTGAIIEACGLVLTEDRVFGYSTDGMVFGQRGGIEIKCPVAADKVAGVWLDPESVIAEFQDQIDGGMWINSWEWIDLVVYTPWLKSIGKELFVHRIMRDEGRIELLEADLLVFSRLVNEIVGRLKRPAAAPDSATAINMEPNF